MATVKDILKAKIDRLREKKQRALTDAADYQARIDAMKAELDVLTPGDESKLQRLQDLAVIKAED